jgi:anti-sigma regulatory factor (Ser/Thr protein kinase)
MARGIRIAVESELETVAHAADRIRRLCAGKLPDDFIQEVEIAFVEALNNVIEHGHTDNKGTIKVSCRLSEKNIVIEIFDQSVTDASEHYSRPDPTSEDCPSSGFLGQQAA